MLNLHITRRQLTTVVIASLVFVASVAFAVSRTSGSFAAKKAAPETIPATGIGLSVAWP